MRNDEAREAALKRLTDALAAAIPPQHVTAAVAAVLDAFPYVSVNAARALGPPIAHLTLTATYEVRWDVGSLSWRPHQPDAEVTRG